MPAARPSGLAGPPLSGGCRPPPAEPGGAGGGGASDGAMHARVRRAGMASPRSREPLRVLSDRVSRRGPGGPRRRDTQPGGCRPPPARAGGAGGGSARGGAMHARVRRAGMASPRSREPLRVLSDRVSRRGPGGPRRRDTQPGGCRPPPARAGGAGGGGASDGAAPGGAVPSRAPRGCRFTAPRKTARGCPCPCPWSKAVPLSAADQSACGGSVPGRSECPAEWAWATPSHRTSDFREIRAGLPEGRYD